MSPLTCSGTIGQRVIDEVVEWILDSIVGRSLGKLDETHANRDHPVTPLSDARRPNSRHRSADLAQCRHLRIIRDPFAAVVEVNGSGNDGIRLNESLLRLHVVTCSSLSCGHPKRVHRGGLEIQDDVIGHLVAVLQRLSTTAVIYAHITHPERWLLRMGEKDWVP